MSNGRRPSDVSHPVVPAPAGEHLCYQREALTALIEGLRTDLFGKMDRLETKIGEHLVECERKHGPLSGALDRIRDRLEDYGRDFSRHGERHDRIDEQLRRTAGLLGEAAQSIRAAHARLKRLEERADAIETAQQNQAVIAAQATGERRVWGRILPLLGAGTGGGALAWKIVELIGGGS